MQKMWKFYLFLITLALGMVLPNMAIAQQPSLRIAPVRSVKTPNPEWLDNIEIDYKNEVSVPLSDKRFSLNWKAGGGYLQPKAESKIPLDQEPLDSGFSLPFIGPSIASLRFSMQPDTGVQVSGALPGKVDYTVGLYNGSGGAQAPTGLIYAGRFVWNPLRSFSFGGKDGALLAIGLGAGYLPGFEPGPAEMREGTDILPVSSDVYQLRADIAIKYSRFTMEVGYYFLNIEPQESNGAYAGSDEWGMYAQAGFFLIPDLFELVGRYSYVDPDSSSVDGAKREHEATAGLNYLFYPRHLKAQLNYSYFRTDDVPEDLGSHMIQATMVIFF